MPRTISAIDTEAARAPSCRDSSQGERRPGFAIRRILVVCLGNVCRSPMVEFVLRRHLAGRAVVVKSAGIGAIDGTPIDPKALAVLESRGLGGRGHLAQRLEKWMIDQADLVLVMEHAHMALIRRWIPSAAGKTFLLGKWLDGLDLPDPFGQPLETFERLYATIDIAAQRWCERV